MTKIISLPWLFVSLLAVSATSSATAPGASSVAPSDPVLGLKKKISAWSYSKEFARRFNLPEMTDEGLPADISAVELRLVWRDLDNDSSFYDCELHAYVNNMLKIFYPEGEVGSIETLVMGRPAQPARMPSTEDRLFHAEMSGRYRTKAIFSSYSDKKPSLGGGIAYRHYRKYFLPDLAYLSFSLGGCSAIGNPSEYKYSLWIEKEGGPDYRRGSKGGAQSYANNFHQFSVPGSLVRRFYPSVELANAKNRERIAADDKARREKLQQQRDNQPKR